MKNQLCPPKFVKIGYADFRIKPFSPDKEKDENCNQGETNFADHEILYTKKQNKLEHTNTILHEVLHSICYIFGLKFTKFTKEEECVNTLANGLITLFRDNPEFLSWLQENIHEIGRDSRVMGQTLEN